MFLNILDEKRKTLLREIGSLSFISRFTMGGGTALSLQMGLRESYDFDFFAADHFDTDQLTEELTEAFGSRLEKVSQGKRLSSLSLYIDGIQVRFFECKYPALEDRIILEGMQNITLSAVNDIACTKAVDIAQRGTKKDFFDLYFIMQEKGLDTKMLIGLLTKKFSDRNLLTNVGYSLSYFEDAEEDVLPKAFVSYSWDEIKRYFSSRQADFLETITKKIKGCPFEGQSF